MNRLLGIQAPNCMVVLGLEKHQLVSFCQTRSDVIWYVNIPPVALFLRAIISCLGSDICCEILYAIYLIYSKTWGHDIL